MNTVRVRASMLTGSLVVLLGSVLSLAVANTKAADFSAGHEPGYPLQLAQQTYTPGKWPGEYGADSGRQGMTAPGMGPGRQGMMTPGMGPGSQTMMPGAQGMGMPSGGGAQPTGPGSGSRGYGIPPGGQQHGMTGGPMGGGPMGGGPMAMFNAIAASDLSDDQRSKLDALRKGLNTRLQEIMGKINAESEKMRKLQEEQMRLVKTLTDLRGHMLQATMDAANRAEELLTDEQREAMIAQGRHIMMQPGGLPYTASQGGKSE